MNRIRTRSLPEHWSVLLLIGLLLPAALGATAVTCVQNICDLGNLGGTQGSFASYVNAAGDVVGYSDISGNTAAHAFLYLSGETSITDLAPGAAFISENVFPQGLNANGQVSGIVYAPAPNAFLYNGSLTNLGTLGGSVSLGYGINNAGTVVGLAATGSGSSHAFSYSNGTMTDLMTLGGASADADFINQNGWIAGNSSLSGQGQSEAFLLQSGNLQTGTVTAITIGGGSTALGLNSSGQVVGDGYLTSGTHGTYQAFLYTPGSTGAAANGVDIGTAWNGDPGHLLYVGNNEALAINDLGEVVGWADISAGQHHAVIFTHVGGNYTMTDLGTLEGGLGISQATAVNALGEVVGTASTATGTDPFLYFNGSMVDLNSLLPANSGFSQLLTVTGISDTGVIIGQGSTTSGATDGYVLTYSLPGSSTPEPSTVISMAFGLLLCTSKVLRPEKRSLNQLRTRFDPRAS